MAANPEEKLKAFFKQSKPQLYKKGETILQGDEIPTGVFFINRGYARNYSFSENGEEFTFIIYRKSDFFPIVWTFNETRKHYFIEAITPCIIFKRNREDFLDFLKKNPEVFVHIVAKISRRFDGLLERMEHMAFGNAYQKVCSILFVLSERFGKEVKNKEIMIDLPLTHKDIANLLGVARETVSVEVAKMKKEGIIKNSGKHIYIVDIKRLKDGSLIV